MLQHMPATKIVEWTKESRRNRIFSAQRELLDSADRTELDTEHYFAEGVYVRSLHIPKGVCVVGKIHKTEHMCFLMKGSLLVATEDGEKIVTAPHIVVSPPGTKRLGLALEDTLWVNIHPTYEKDLAKIEEQFIEPETELALDNVLREKD